MGEKPTCSRCGRQHTQDPSKKRGHFHAVCRSAKIAGLCHDDQSGDAFLGVVNDVNSKPWNISLLVNDKLVEFCIDAGAEVSGIPTSVYELLGRQPTQATLPVDRNLKGPSNNHLKVRTRFSATLQKGNQSIIQSINVVENLQKPLLGRPAIEFLGLLKRIGAIEKQAPVDQFPTPLPKSWKTRRIIHDQVTERG